MQRTAQNLKLYKQSCEKVLDRADNRCEVMVDKFGMACTDLPKKRCLKFIPTDTATYTNFLHKSTRNGKTEDWVLDPDNIVLGCEKHHREEETTGIRVQQCDYSEISYIPDDNS